MDNLGIILLLQATRLLNELLAIYMSYKFTMQVMIDSFHMAPKGGSKKVPFWYKLIVKYLFYWMVGSCVISWLISFVFVCGVGMNDIWPIIQNFTISIIAIIIIISFEGLKNDLQFEIQQHEITIAKVQTQTKQIPTTNVIINAYGSNIDHHHEQKNRESSVVEISYRRLTKMNNQLFVSMLMAAFIALIFFIRGLISLKNFINNGISNFFDPPFTTQSDLIHQTIGFILHEIFLFIWTHSKYPKYCGLYCAEMNENSIIYVMCSLCFIPCSCIAPIFFDNSRSVTADKDRNSNTNMDDDNKRTEKQDDSNSIDDKDCDHECIRVPFPKKNYSTKDKDEKNTEISKVSVSLGEETTNLSKIMPDANSKLNVINIPDEAGNQMTQTTNNITSNYSCNSNSKTHVRVAVYNFENTFLCNCNSLMKLQKQYVESKVLCLQRLKAMSVQQIVKLVFNNIHQFDMLKQHLILMNNNYNQKCLSILVSTKYNTNLIYTILHRLELSKFFISDDYQSKLTIQNNFDESGIVDTYLMRRIYGKEHDIFDTKMMRNRNSGYKNSSGSIIGLLSAILWIGQLYGNELLYIDSDGSLLQHINSINLCSIYYCQTKNGLTFNDILDINLIYMDCARNDSNIHLPNNAILSNLNDNNSDCEYEDSAKM